MRIVDLVARHVRIPLKRRIRHASFSRDENDTLVVCCTLDSGQVGWGEGLPRPYVTGETIESALAQFQATDLRGQLGESFDDLRGAIELCDRLTLAPPLRKEGLGGSRESLTTPPDQPSDSFISRGCFGNAVHCAIELAILDAAARTADVPLSAVTPLVPETAAIREPSNAVQYSAVLTAESPLKQWLSAWKCRLYGFAQVKVKVGVAGADDAALLRKVRRILPTVDLRLDANEAWSCDQMETRLAPLREFGVTSVEQPVPHAQADGLAALRGRLGVPIMLDESLCSAIDAQRAIERGTCDLFNLRLSKCGGFLRALLLAAMAHRAGLGYQLGCQVGETGILSAAGRHFATSVGGIRYLEGSYDRHLVKERLTVEDLTFGYGGRASAIDRPGLGVTINPAALKRVTVAERSWRPGDQ